MLRYQRMVGGGQGLSTSHRTGGCGNNTRAAHTPVHTCTRRSATKTWKWGQVRPTQMGGKKRKKSLEGEEERMVMPRRALGGPHTWKPGERHVLGANTQALSRERNLGSLAEGSPISPQRWWVQQCPRSLALRAPGQARTPQGRETHNPHPQSLATSLPWDTCHVWGQASLVTSSIRCQRAKKDNQKALGHRLRSKGVSPTSAL